MTSSSTPPVPVLLPDQPVSLDDDAFGHASYATVIAEALASASQPLTLGLFGPWGVGKSSVLKSVQRMLKTTDCDIVIYDAWRYDGATLRRHLLSEVVRQLRKQEGIDEDAFDPERRLQDLEVDVQQTTSLTRPTPGSLRVAGLQVAVVAACVGLVLALNPLPDTSSAVLALALGLIIFLGTAAGQVFRVVPLVHTRRRLEDPEGFHQLFRELLEIGCALQPRRSQPYDPGRAGAR